MLICSEVEIEEHNYLFSLSSSNTGNIFLQLYVQQCCVASCDVMFHVLPSTYTTFTQQIYVLQVRVR
jgi:hypothetical protein